MRPPNPPPPPDGQPLSQMNSTRLRLSQRHNSSSLTILQAQPRLDEATYECALAESPFAKAHQFQLKLLVPPRLAPFEFPADAQVGMKVLLTCSALEGQQPISFVWLRDNQIIDPAGSSAADAGAPSSPSSSAESKGLTTGHRDEQLVASLGQLHQQQLADKFALSAHSAISLGDKSEYVLIGPAPQTAATSGAGKQSPAARQHELSNIVDDENENDDADAAGPLLARSKVAGARQKPATMHVSDASIRIRQADDYSILSIEPLELKHSGRYTCSAQNEAARVSHSSQLIINGELRAAPPRGPTPLLYPAGGGEGASDGVEREMDLPAEAAAAVLIKTGPPPADDTQAD
jgi:hypothetical protein